MNIVQGGKQTPPALAADDWKLERPVGDEISLRSILGVLNYRRWRVVLPGLACAAAAAALTTQMSDYYSASTQIMLNASEPNLVDIDSVLTTLPDDSRLIEGEVAVILSIDALHNAASRLGLYNDPEFSGSDQAAPLVPADPAPAAPDDASGERQLTHAEIETIQMLRDAIDVSQAGLSLVISISATSKDPEKAAVIANGVAREYIESRVDLRLQATRDAVDWISARAESLRSRLEEAEKAVEDFKADMVADDGQTSDVTAQQLTETNSQLVLARARRAEADARLAEIERRIRMDGSAAVELLVPTPSIDRLRADMEVLAVERSELVTQFGESYPRIQGIDARMRDLDRRLDAEIARGVSAVAGESAAAHAREKEMAKSLAELEQRLAGQADQTLELRQLERVAEADRRIYETFLGRLNELTQQISIQQADARVVSRAVPSDAPAKPNRPLMVLAAGMFGVLAGCAAAFAGEAARTNFLTDIDVTRRTGLRVITRLPRLGRRASLPEVLRRANDDPFGAVGHALRDINIALLSAGPGRIRTVLVTSARRAEGRTTVALLIAEALGRVGRKAVVVDCDFAQPALSRTFGAVAGPDVIDVLAGNASLEAAVRRDAETGLWYLPMVDRKGYGPDVLYTEAFQSMLAEIGENWDVAVLDAPPLMVSPDAAAMSRLSDLVVVAIRWRSTSQELVESGLAQLRRGGANRVGAVLTQINVAKEATYRRRVYNMTEG